MPHAPSVPPSPTSPPPLSRARPGYNVLYVHGYNAYTFLLCVRDPPRWGIEYGRLECTP